MPSRKFAKAQIAQRRFARNAVSLRNQDADCGTADQRVTSGPGKPECHDGNWRGKQEQNKVDSCSAPEADTPECEAEAHSNEEVDHSPDNGRDVNGEVFEIPHESSVLRLSTAYMRR